MGQARVLTEILYLSSVHLCPVHKSARITIIANNGIWIHMCQGKCE